MREQDASKSDGRRSNAPPKPDFRREQALSGFAAPIRAPSRAARVRMRAQATLEFMLMLGLFLSLLVISVSAYALLSSEGSAFSSSLAASGICNHLSALLVSQAWGNGNSSMVLNLPPAVNGQNYTLYLSAPNSTLRVNYGQQGAGCYLPSIPITNSTGAAFFAVAPNATINSSDGVLVIVP